MKIDWQKLLEDWTITTEPYGFGQWNVIVEGLVESLCEAAKVQFVLSPRIFYNIQKEEPSVVFSVYFIPDDPLQPRMAGLCSIDTDIEEDGTKHSGASMVLFHYRGNERIVQKDGKSYEFWQFSKDETQMHTWTNHGWFHDESGEWEGYTWDSLVY